MGRALLTPDELRRLDVDECIIYEKGIKPIKAPKYYYYKYPIDKTIKKYAIDHNTREDIERGKWRKYNPYNPYTEDEDNTEKTKIEQLDDLFKDDDEPEKPKEEKAPIPDITSIDDIPVELPMEPKEEIKEEPKEQPVVDLQKELEAKFDELFGSLNDID